MRRVVLIGIDGLDPNLVEAMLGNGELPGFSKLAQRGGWARLQTTNPALSPTAWSTIATGCNPGMHGLFDFIYRETGSYLPRLSVNRPNPRNYFGDTGRAYLAARQGRAFWTWSSAQKIPTTVLKWPVTFPPEPLFGKMLAGLGVPDVRGTLGRYTFYSTAPRESTTAFKGDILRLMKQDSFMESVVIGPDGVTVPIRFSIESPQTVSVTVQNQQVKLGIHEWSSWIPVTFHRFGFPQIRGIFRLYAVSFDPEFQIYSSVVHMDPAEPPFPLSSPADYAQELAKSLGPFHTLGLPEETNGLVDDMISEEAFLQHADDIFKEREALFDYEWNRFREGIFAFVFDTLDRIQHTMWNDLSEDVPLHRRRMKEVKRHYQKLDAVVQRLLSNLNEEDVLLVVSDHGFSTFHKALHVNSWLRDQGYLVLKSGQEGIPLFENVDWKKTRAYALGFVSLLLNVEGREPEGVVAQHNTQALQEELMTKLQEWKDPSSGERVLHRVYNARAIYQGPFVDHAPDLVLGPRRGYRVSWQTGYGAAPKESIEINSQAWRADHIMDPSFVPGVLFSNQVLNSASPHVRDVAPTVVQAFQKTPELLMEGTSVLNLKN